MDIMRHSDCRVVSSILAGQANKKNESTQVGSFFAHKLFYPAACGCYTPTVVTCSTIWLHSNGEVHTVRINAITPIPLAAGIDILTNSSYDNIDLLIAIVVDSYIFGFSIPIAI